MISVILSYDNTANIILPKQSREITFTMVKTPLGRIARPNSDFLLHIYCVREHTWNPLYTGCRRLHERQKGGPQALLHALF